MILPPLVFPDIILAHIPYAHLEALGACSQARPSGIGVIIVFSVTGSLGKLARLCVHRKPFKA